jgi:hypothetical protein
MPGASILPLFPNKMKPMKYQINSKLAKQDTMTS